jgi:outer membrane usher protein FimD/PapC
VKAVWYTVDDAGTATKIAEKEIVGSGSPITFNAANNAGPWPAGKYRVEIYLNDAVNKTIDFSVQ